MIPCVICKKESVRPFELASGAVLGRVCSNIECGQLLWEGHLNAKYGATKDESASLAWRISKMRGFNYPAPPLSDPSAAAAKLLEARFK